MVLDTWCLILAVTILLLLSLHLHAFHISMGDDGLTTNAHDLQEAAKLQARLEAQAADTKASSSNTAAADTNHNADGIPSVLLDEGAYKYVLIAADTSAGQQRIFVYSKRNASYHRNVAEYLLPQLEGANYTNIRITGGGRILRDDEDKKVHIFGYSYGFGQANHSLAKDIVEQSDNYQGYNVTWSNDGY